MTEPTFPRELVQRCGERVWELHLNGPVTASEIVEAILLAARHDKLVATLRKCRKGYLNLAELYAIDTREAIAEIDAALTAAAPLARVEAD